MLKVRTFLARSEIHGFGLFAAEPIAAGTVIWTYDPTFDVAFDKEDFAKLPAPPREQIKKYYYFDRALSAYVLCGDDNRFINHSGTPNTREDDVVGTLALRLIERGEEITCDYGDLGIARPTEPHKVKIKTCLE